MGNYNYNDYIGKKYNRLTIKGFYKTGYIVYAHCECDCGNTKDVRFSALVSNNTKSCGCLKREVVTKKNKNSASYNGESNTRLYRCYKSMLYRCNDSNCKDYIYYGKRGITVCDSWNESFNSFKDWALTNGYSDSLTLDRIDVDGDYEPSNCRWVGWETQVINRRDDSIITHNLSITYNGCTKTLKDWSKELNIKYSVLRDRYKKGWSVDKMFSTPVRKRNIYLEYNGITDTVNNWAHRFCLPESTFKNRLYRCNYDLYKVVNKYNMDLIDNTEVIS